jgi:replicative DNA helicase
MFECVERCEELQDKGGITGVPTGYIDLDALLCGFQGGDLILLAGRPSMGKTALMNCAAVNAAERGFPSAICQLEMTNIQTGNRLLALNGKVNSMKFRSGKFSNEDWFKIQSTASKLSGYKIYVDDSAVSNYQEIQKKARYAVKNYDIKILFIDYLGFIDGEKDQGKVNEIQTISRGLKATAKELNIPVILLCQLNRSLEQRPNKRPILSDLRDSGALEQDADVVLFIYRDEVYNKESEFQGVAEINVAKQRNGPTGIIRLAWLPAFTKFENLVREP